MEPLVGVSLELLTLFQKRNFKKRPARMLPYFYVAILAASLTLGQVEGQIIPFEVKYRSQHTAPKDLRGMLDLCQQKSLERAYVITKSINDFGLTKNFPGINTQILSLPAALLCYWMGEAELTPLEND